MFIFILNRDLWESAKLHSNYTLGLTRNNVYMLYLHNMGIRVSNICSDELWKDKTELLLSYLYYLDVEGRCRGFKSILKDKLCKYGLKFDEPQTFEIDIPHEIIDSHLEAHKEIVDGSPLCNSQVYIDDYNYIRCKPQNKQYPKGKVPWYERKLKVLNSEGVLHEITREDFYIPTCTHILSNGRSCKQSSYGAGDYCLICDIKVSVNSKHYPHALRNIDINVVKQRDWCTII